ncbi:hypothetical protein GLOIN_2v500423 [Rhizophagus irregularis DAOM 181602=DAOM 197198]|nr:hypothetical protein GLOIN_2v500423 [Rhizophagus irregularis DAOM 181602=DAOM 197198]
MDKNINIPTISTGKVETLQTLSQRSTISEEVGTDEGPEHESDYSNESEPSSSDSGEEGGSHDDDNENEFKGEKLDDLSDYSSSENEKKKFEDFEKNIKSLSLDDELDLKGLEQSGDLTSKHNLSELNELQGVSREEYRQIIGEFSYVDEPIFINKRRHRKVPSSREQRKNRPSQEEKIHEEQEQKVDQSHQKQISQEKEYQQKQLLNEQQLQEESSKEDLKRESQRLSQKEQLRHEGQLRKKESQLQNQGQNLLQQRPSPFLQYQHLQSRPNSSQIQRSTHDNIFKPVIKSQNEKTSLITPSLSFHLPDISLSQQSNVRNFRQMNIIENNVKGPIAALRTLTDNYRQLELDKQNADIKVRQLEMDKQSADVKVNQLEKQLEQYRQLLQKEQSKSKANNKHNEKTFYIVPFTEANPSMIYLQKKYKVIKRQLEYMKTYALKAEDERDEAKKALIKTKQDITQMNDQFESLRASVQIPNKRTQLSNIAVPTQPISLTSPELPRKPFEKTNELSDINNIEVQENNQIIEPKETKRDSGSEKSKSLERADQEQIKKIQEEIESHRVDRENLRKQRQAMEKTHRKKTVPKGEITSIEENENVEGSEDGRKTNRYRGLCHKENLQNYEDSYMDKKRHTNLNEDCHIEQQYNEGTYNNSKVFNKRTTNNKMQFGGYNEDNQNGDYREQQYYEHYGDEPHENLQFAKNRRLPESFEQDQNIDPREQHYYNEKRGDQRRDNHYTRNFSEQDDGDQSPHLPGRQRQFYDNMKEDPDIHPNDLRLSPTRSGRIYSQYSNESRDSVYIHIKDRKQYVRHTYDDFEEEGDYFRDCDYREELKSDNQSISMQQDYPVWKDIKNGKSYLRNRDYIIQEQKPMRSGGGREIPFILGTGTGKSHSVTVNLQKAFALLKNHCSNSCSVCNKKNTKNATNKNKLKKQSYEKEESPDIALGRVISNLMDELKHLKMYYSNLVDEYQRSDPLDCKSKRTALAEELKEIMDQMEIKGDQIATLYDIQQKTVKPSLSSKSRYGFTQNKNNFQKPTHPVHETRAESLNSLRGTRKVQKTLNDL